MPDGLDVCSIMIHDDFMPSANSGDDDINGPRDRESRGLLDINRRRSDRLPFPAELVLAWMHDLGTPLRFRIVDAGDGGYRIRSRVPAVEGMTAIAVKFLPSGDPIDRPVMVSWVGPPDENGECDIGLRCF
jgi:hypothetical protein